MTWSNFIGGMLLGIAIGLYAALFSITYACETEGYVEWYDNITLECEYKNAR